MEQETKSIGIPLLGSVPNSGTASKAQTLGNIIVTIVGTGVLGLPFAFRVAGWLAGALGVIIAGISNYYCMLLLIRCREKLAEEPSGESRTYGDLGYICMGTPGRYLTEFLISISQCAGAVAYLVFIGQNLLSVFNGCGLSLTSYVFLIVPIEIGLSWIGSLAAFAPFSIFADVCNALAMGIVLKEDIQQVLGAKFLFAERTVIASNIGGLPFAAGMAVFCFEGFGMTLALQNSMKDKTTFPRLLAQAVAGITLVYVSFGFFGYMAYGDQTRDIVTLNLQRNWSSLAVQVGLCLALVFTFPIMLHPINEIVEERLKRGKKLHNSNIDDSTIAGKVGKYISRAVLVILLAVLTSFVPQFGVLASLAGSTVCALISFVLPATFHLRIFGASLHLWQKFLDCVIVSCGLLFAAYGTYNAVFGV